MKISTLDIRVLICYYDSMNYDKENFTDNANTALMHAGILAKLSSAQQINTSHLLVAIASIEDSVGSRVLRRMGVDTKKLRNDLGIKTQIVPDPSQTNMTMSAAMQLTVQMSHALAEQCMTDLVGTEHLLFCLLTQRHSVAVKMLTSQGVDIDNLMMELSQYIENNNPDQDEQTEQAMRGKRTADGRRPSMLERFSVDMTKQARDGKLDPVIGRTREIDRLMVILSRRTKNNPVLVGEAGVGKTAIVEGLAERIASGDVPENMANMRILSLDLAAMVAGTKFRGEFEDRLERVIKEAQQDKNIVIFVDEFHLIVGAGSAEGTMDAANILKPVLARGDFRLIGATTADEYRKYIEKDAALSRRMQKVQVDAPNVANTERILTGIAPKYEEFHQVKYSPSILKEVVRLSNRYLTDRSQPDKAIDVMDETGARVHTEAMGSDQVKEIRQLKVESRRLSSEMEAAVAREDYEQAALNKMRLSQTQEKLKKLESKKTSGGKITIKQNDVAKTVSRMTGVPLAQLEKSEISKLINLEKNIGQKLIGQEAAVSAVSQAVRRSRAGIADPNRPIGSFIFLGPTGVGKTELAKVLAEEVFGSRDALIKFDMSEFSEKYSVSRLTGTTPGYVGYEDGGQLTERVRQHPYSVILFDEIEKADFQVFNILLQILEDGVLTDGHGKKVDFRNCIIILTSNIGSAELDGMIGYAIDGDEGTNQMDEQRRQVVLHALRETMRPELINRFDKIVVFNGLHSKELNQICDLMIARVTARLMEQGIGLTVTSKAKQYLVKKGTNVKFGARPLRREIQDELEMLIADQIISGQVRRGDMVKADLKNGQIVLTQQEEGKTRAKSSKASRAKVASKE